MSLRLSVRARAREDIGVSRDWYDEKSPELGCRFEIEVDAAMVSISRQPLRYPKVYLDIRRAMTTRFPFAIYFIFEGDRIAVLRVLHQARDPREWQRSG